MENEKNYPYAYGFLQGRIKAIISDIKFYGGDVYTAKFLQNALDDAAIRETLSSEAVYQAKFLEEYNTKGNTKNEY